MAALTLAAGLLPHATGRADDRPGTGPSTATAPATAPVARPAPAPATNLVTAHRVRLELRIAGLSRAGCDVVIKPAYAACTFKTTTLHVEPNGEAVVDVKDVHTESADRDCSFSITLREPGLPPQTSVRGLRLSATASATPQLLSCYLSAPSRIARMSEPETTRKR